MTLRNILLGATVLCAATTPVYAFAQDAAPADAGTTVDDTDYGNDIIVTASKRSQTLQDTPVAVSVTSAAQLEEAQIRDLIDLQSSVPSLRVSQLQSSANTNFIIRGFGNGANNAGIEPSVGVFIDGVYRSRSAAQIGDLPNVERIEVLRGPQSTLFGKNASAGVISIVTQKPQFEFGGSAEVTYGNYDAITVKGDVTGPISDTIAFSIGGSYNRRDGYAQDLKLDTDVNDRNRWGVRGQLLFEPTDALSIRLIGDYDKIDENCCIAGNVIAGPTVAITNALAGGPSVDANDPFSYDVYNNFLSSNKIKNYGGSAQIDYDLGNLALTSITAYRKVQADTNQDSDFTAADLIGEKSDNVGIDTFTQEIRLTSDFDGPLNFLIGGYYFNEKVDQQSAIKFGQHFRPYGDALIRAASGNALNVGLLEGTLGALEGAPTKYLGTFFRAGNGLDEDYQMKNEAFSIFGTVDFEVTDRLTLTLGGNYTKDRKRFSTNVVSSDVFSGVNLDAAAYTPFRQALLIGQGVPAPTAAFLAANPTLTLPDGRSANPLAGLKAFQFLPPFLNLPNAVESGKTNDGDFSYSVRAAYELTDTVNIYATYATGFKASSVNLSRDSRPLASDLAAITAAGLRTPNLVAGSRFADPEESTVYEFGLKGQWDVAAVNVAVFKQSIKGFQSNVFTGTGFALANAGKQSTFGIEFDGSVRPVAGLNLTLAATYLDAKYDSFINSAFGDISGSTPAGIPELSLSLGGTYTHEFAGGTKAIAHVDYAYESPVQIVEGLGGFPASVAQNLKREVNSLNASFTIRLTNGIDVGVWGRNLTNAQYLTTIFPAVAQAGSVSGYPSQPRTYGGTIRYKF
ncbi:TonB-dependent receptor [Sphingopyxis sp. H038]|uniref:TonB-dependent receptor n=1 Tax=unclassified Sphingopyxis TaxID=2614943 RepID=UPI000730DB98|nr:MULTISPECIES: TonB-dependent receptor [unclassified Sphingopyxis]KTE04615.1 TonB-dependent receptor [Sphingopyxis sp. H012]KTE07852.1 TonB-dependent receptor [Sphingopyxis sp. H093]KTE13173.1 TonB-dependent receptor [Sphingopyxis sp. H053]KTE31011.1 TonB-dependent receptor [Sphingopyxis sp. H080]KTE37112.1 TonB-dependent receptor [Sphingopyxis sp. H038]